MSARGFPCLSVSHTTPRGVCRASSPETHRFACSGETRRTSSRAGQLRRLRSSLGAAAFSVFASLAHAGGMDAPHVESDPCIPLPASAFDGMTGDMLAMWGAVQAMKDCPPPVFIDRATGLPLTDEEILARVFNGSSPTVIPLPAGVWLLLAALAMLSFKRRA